MKKRMISIMTAAMCCIGAVYVPINLPNAFASENITGDANCDNEVNMADSVLIMQSIANPAKFGIEGTDENHITEQGKKNADITGENDGITNADALAVQKKLLGLNENGEDDNTIVYLAVTTSPDMAASVHTETTTCTTKAEPVVKEGNGDVLIIAEFSEQMGNQPLRVSKEESEMLINMFNEIELEPVDQPVRPENPMDEVFGGGYILYIEGGDKIVIRGNRNVMINDKFYYDVNNKSDELSGQIGYVLYGYYGAP